MSLTLQSHPLRSTLPDYSPKDSPSTPPMSTAPKPYDPIALTGFTAASAYDAHRPSYAPTALSHLLTHLHVSHTPGAKILDLAAGTGKFTELLAARDERYDIVAVEPHKDMIATLKKKELAGVEVKEGDAYAIPVRDGWADAVVIAQAFHWFATSAALTELSRVLAPGGRIGLIWNVEDYNQARDYATKTKWEGELKDVNWKYTTDTSSRYKDLQWSAVFGNQTLFSKLEEKIFEVEIWLDVESLWKRLGTLSNIANLSSGEKEELRREFDGVLERGKDVERNEKGEIAVHYIVHTAWATKL